MRALIGCGVVALVALAGCGRTDSVDSTETVAGTTTSSLPDPTASSVSATTVRSSTTIEPTTTVESSTTVASTTVAPTPSTEPPTTGPTTTQSPPATPRPQTAFVIADGDLVEVDVATGAIVALISEFFDADGVFRYGLRPTADRTTIWFNESYEDGWYGCESSVGNVGRIDIASGAIEILGPGSGVSLAPNDELLAHLGSAVCVPDPEAPDFWVLTPYDRVVVRQLASGEIREFVTAATLDGSPDPGVVEWAGFSPAGDLLVLTADGQLRNVDINGSSTIQDHPVVLPEVIGFPIAATATALVTIVGGDEGSTDLYSLDAVSGAPTLLASSEAFMNAAVNASGHVVVVAFDEVSVAPGADLTVVSNPDGAFIGDVGW